MWLQQDFPSLFSSAFRWSPLSRSVLIVGLLGLLVLASPSQARLITLADNLPGTPHLSPNYNLSGTFDLTGLNLLPGETLTSARVDFSFEDNRDVHQRSSSGSYSTGWTTNLFDPRDFVSISVGGAAAFASSNSMPQQVTIDRRLVTETRYRYETYTVVRREAYDCGTVLRPDTCYRYVNVVQSRRVPYTVTRSVVDQTIYSGFSGTFFQTVTLPSVTVDSLVALSSLAFELNTRGTTSLLTNATLRLATTNASVPESSSLALLGCGIAGLIALRRPKQS